MDMSHTNITLSTDLKMQSGNVKKIYVKSFFSLLRRQILVSIAEVSQEKQEDYQFEDVLSK